MINILSGLSSKLLLTLWWRYNGAMIDVPTSVGRVYKHSSLNFNKIERNDKINESKIKIWIYNLLISFNATL